MVTASTWDSFYTTGLQLQSVLCANAGLPFGSQPWLRRLARLPANPGLGTDEPFQSRAREKTDFHDFSRFCARCRRVLWKDALQPLCCVFRFH